MQNTDTIKISILKKFKSRVLKNIWEEGEKISAEDKIQNIFSFQKENSPTAYIQGEIKTENKIYTPSLYYHLKKNYVEVFSCTCRHEKKGPCSHVAALFISVINKFYLAEKDTIDLKILNSNKVVSLFKNFIRENETSPSASVIFKIEIDEDKNIFLRNFNIQYNQNGRTIKVKKFFTDYFNSFLEKESVSEYFQEKEHLIFESHSCTFLNILENYFRHNRDKLDEKGDFQVPEFLLPALLPLFPYLCRNYISKEKEPEILISLKNDFIILKLKDFTKWNYLKNDYMFYRSEKNFIKIIFFPKYERKINILNYLVKNENLTFYKNDIDLGTVISALRKIIKVTFSEEITSKYYIPEKIESGILITAEDDSVSLSTAVVYDGRRKEEIEKPVLSDENLENKVLEKAENYIKKYIFKKIPVFYRRYKLFRFLSHEILKTPPNLHIIFDENMKNARFTSGYISMENTIENNQVKIKIFSDNFTSEETAEILLTNLRKKYFHLKNNSFLEVKNFDLLKISHKVLGLNVSYKELTAKKFYRPDIFYFYINNFTFNGMNMKKFTENFTTENFSLRDYQKYGVDWLLNMKEKNWGGILSDGAMLGKKLQVLTFLHLQSSKNKLPNLILTDNISEILSWEEEIQKFYKDMSYKTVDKVLENENIFSNLSEGEIILTTYCLFKENYNFFEEIKFENVILGKGEVLKNLSPDVFNSILNIKRNTAYALTNLPLNFLFCEIWWIMNIAVPNYFPDLKTFQNKYFHSESGKGRVRELVNHLILRREKSSVEKFLPKKIEKNIFFSLEKNQKNIYEAFRLQYKNSFKNNLKTEKKVLQEAFYNLKNTALLPVKTVLDTCTETKHEKFKKVNELLVSLCKNRYKILVVSKVPSFFKVKSRFLEKNFTEGLIDCNTPLEKSKKIIKRFNEEGLDVLLISSKLKLPQFKFYNVDAVIYADPWHNENIEKYIENFKLKKVIVYNFYALDTIEEKIYKLKSEKNISKFNFSKNELLNFFE